MSLATIERRIKKAEAQLGINEPCAVCEVTNRCIQRLIAVRKLPIAGRRDAVSKLCAWCGTPYRVDYGGYSSEMAVEGKELDALHEAGKYCDPEVQARYKRWRAQMEQRNLEVYGPEYTAIMQEVEREMDEVTRGRDLLFPYVCTVEGCTCGAQAA